MIIEPRTLDLSSARRLIPREPWLRTNRSFYEGDHWQNGQGWIGPRPGPREAGFQNAMREIESAFVSRNVVAEIVERHTAGVLGREPRFGLTLRRPMAEGEEPTKEEARLIDEAEAILTGWWDERKVPAVLQDAVGSLLWSQRAPLRLYIPRGLLDFADDGSASVTAGSIEEALDKLWPDTPDPEAATAFLEEDTKRPVGVYVYRTDDNRQRAEVVFIGDNGETIIRVLDSDRDAADYPLNLGGRLPIYEMRRPLLITPQIRQQQRAMNLALSVSPRNVVMGGFLERVLLNAQMPGRYETDDETGEERFIPEPYRTGSGTTNFVQGTEYEDEEGRIRRADPDIRWRPPVGVDAAIEAERNHYRGILEEADQAHALISSESTASGRSREHARTDYISSLRLTAGETEAAGRWVIETALAMAEAIVGDPGRYTNTLRADFSCRLDSGPIAADERNQNVSEYEKGTLSKATAMSRNGIDDVDAEETRMSAEDGHKLNLLRRQAETLKELVQAGAELGAAARVVGMDDETVEALVSGYRDETLTQ